VSKRGLWLVAGGYLTLAVVRAFTGNDQLTSSGTWGAMLRLAVPIMLAGLGGMYAERAGVINIGLEGMMMLGTWFGAYGALTWGPWEGMLFGLVGGMLGGLLHALATITFNIDHIVSGVAMNIIGFNVARFLASLLFTDIGGGATQSPAIGVSISKINLPILSGGTVFGWQTPDFFGWLEDTEWLLIADVGGLLKGLTSDLSWFTIIAFSLIPLSAWVLWRTPFGLRLRSCGEDPWGAESVGVRVKPVKYIAVSISGAMAGLAGAFLVLEQAGLYRENQTQGRGFIGLAAMIFGNWRPSGVLAGGGLFGYGFALQLREPEAVHGLLVFLGLIMVVFAYMLYRRYKRGASWVGMAVAGLLGVSFFVLYFVLDVVPGQFVRMSPYVLTLVVLAIRGQKLRMPAADGARYRKGEAH
jgi:simple sugar transport system permease protein